MKTLHQRTKEVLEKILDQAIDRQFELEVGIEIKEMMIMEAPDHESVPKIQSVLNQEKFMLDNQHRAIDILQRKLAELYELETDRVVKN